MRLAILILSLRSWLVVHGHMEMTDPPPIKSPHNPHYDYSSTDYSYNNPIHANGNNFPCKGYHRESKLPVVTYEAGTAK